MAKTNTIQAGHAKPNTHSLGVEGRRELISHAFSKQSRFEKEFGTTSVDLECAAFTQILRAEVIRLLAENGVQVPDGNLEQLHNHITSELKDYNFDDGVNKISGFLYNTDDTFKKNYHQFIKTCVGAHFPYPFYFQATPTIRIQCPNAKNSDHYPRYHTDVGYGHPPEEVNIWIPLTEAVLPQYHGFRLMNVKSSYDALAQFDFDFSSFIDRAIHDKSFDHELDKVAPPVTTPFGKMIAFDSRSIHTGEALQRHTRVSVDIRIIPVDDFDNLSVEYQGTGRRKIRFVPGEGYDNLSSSEL